MSDSCEVQMTERAVILACLVLVASQTGCSVVHEPVAPEPNWYSYRYTDVSLRPVPVSLGYLDEADRWLRECQVSAWVVPVTRNRVLSNYLLLLIALRAEAASTVEPRPGHFAVFFTEIAYKPIILEREAVATIQEHQRLQLMVDLGPDQEVWGGYGKELVLESAGNDDEWPWKRRAAPRRISVQSR